MSEQSTQTAYDADSVIRPGANLLFFSWLLILGLPVLLLFLIFSKHAA